MSPFLTADKKSILKYHHLSPDSNVIFSMQPQPLLVYELAVLGQRVDGGGAKIGRVTLKTPLTVVVPKHISGPASRLDGVMSRNTTERLHQWPRE